MNENPTPSSGRAAGKVALISGAAQGMGASHARALAAAGASVMIGDLQEEAGTALAEEINAAADSQAATFTPLNVTDPEAWTAAVGHCVREFGKLDAQVNNAGIYTPGTVEEASVEDWTRTLDFGEDGIRVNSIHPGSVETPLTAGLKRGFGQVPAGRAAQVEEISSLVLYPASDESRFVSGTSIATDGGETAGNTLRQGA